MEWGAIISGLKVLPDLVEKSKDKKINAAVVELQAQIIGIQQDFIRLTDEKEKLKKAAELQKVVIFKRPYVYLDGDPVSSSIRGYRQALKK